jgi:hypothetical protein
MLIKAASKTYMATKNHLLKMIFFPDSILRQNNGIKTELP